MFSGVSLEAWLGAVISLVIIKAGVDILCVALGKILGERVDAGLSRDVKACVASMEGVRGAHDLAFIDVAARKGVGEGQLVLIRIPFLYVAIRARVIYKTIGPAAS